MRAKDVRVCSQNKLALFLFDRFMLADTKTNEIEKLDFSTDEWMSLPLFPPYYSKRANNSDRPIEELDGEELYRSKKNTRATTMRISLPRSSCRKYFKRRIITLDSNFLRFTCL